MHNSARLTKGRDRCTLLMHPEDARARGLADGRARARCAHGWARSRRRSSVTDDMRPGVVSLPHGWGHHRPGHPPARGRGAARAPASTTSRTSSAVDVLSGTAALNGVAVDVVRAAPPPTRVV